jgi:hypothetical protein
VEDDVVTGFKVAAAAVLKSDRQIPCLVWIPVEWIVGAASITVSSCVTTEWVRGWLFAVTLHIEHESSLLIACPHDESIDMRWMESSVENLS